MYPRSDLALSSCPTVFGRVAADARKLPFRDLAFKTGLSFDTFELLGNEDATKAIMELCRVSSQVCFKVAHKDWHPTMVLPPELEWARFSENELESLIRQNGFSDFKVDVRTAVEADAVDDQNPASVKCSIYVIARREP